MSDAASQFSRRPNLDQIARWVADSAAGREAASARDAIALEMLAQQERGHRMDFARAWMLVETQASH